MTAADLPTVTAPLLRVVVVGHVDHGKSTLIGRLLYETGALPDAKVAELTAAATRRGMPIEWSFALDALQAERDQAITIDTTQVRFKSALRDYVLVDAPGHKEFLRNMVSGAAAADAAVLVVDAAEGLREQTKRHGFLLSLLGLGRPVVVVNKMDLVGFDPARFAAIKHEIAAYLGSLGIHPAAVVPVAARDGDNLVGPSQRTGWHDGPTLVGALDMLSPPAPGSELPLRLPIQDVYHFDHRRIVAGRIESGMVAVGDRVLFSPSGAMATVKTIEAWNATPPRIAKAGDSVGLTLDDEIFVERGDLASHEADPPMLTTVLRGRIFWLVSEPLQPGRTLTLRLGMREVEAAVQAVERLIDVDTLAEIPADAVERNQIADVILKTRTPVALDPYDRNPRTGRFVLSDGHKVAGGGLVSMQGYPDQRRLFTRANRNIFAVEHAISTIDRIMRNGHAGGVLWLTGLSGAGKSTLAMAAERELFARGFQVYVLDGDNVRAGLCADLGFSPEDRSENIRRVGEVAALMARAGLIVLTAFISPYQSDRARARAAAGSAFREVHVRAPLEVCETRDPKGLYKKARAGKIADFTGISAPYEAPERPELVVDTGSEPPELCVKRLVDFAVTTFGAVHPEI